MMAKEEERGNHTKDQENVHALPETRAKGKESLSEKHDVKPDRNSTDSLG